MEAFKAFERYIARLSEGLGHADRRAGLREERSHAVERRCLLSAKTPRHNSPRN